MPIVNPNNVYSWGDELGAALAQIGGAMPDILDPRRGVRDRAFEIMQDPTKVEALAKRAYAAALTIGEDGIPAIDEEKYSQVIKDLAVTFGLRPDNEKEFNVVRPILDAAVSALPASTKAELELSNMEKFRKDEQKRLQAEQGAATTKAEALSAEAQYTSEYFKAALDADIPAAEIRTRLMEYNNKETAGKILQDMAPTLVELAKDDKRLAGILGTGDFGQAAAYLRDLAAQEARLLSGAIGADGISPTEARGIIEKKQAEMGVLMEKIMEAEGDFEKQRLLVDRYNQHLAEWEALAGAFGIPTSQMPAPILSRRPKWGGVLGSRPAVTWRTQTSFQPAGIPSEQWQAMTTGWGSYLRDNQEGSEEEVLEELRFNPAPLDIMTRTEKLEWLDNLETRAGRMLPKLRSFVISYNAPPALPEGYSALGLLFSPSAREATGTYFREPKNE